MTSTPVTILLKRSGNSSDRPSGVAVSAGEPAICFGATDPGAYFKDSAGNIRKVGPTHYGATAPNSTPVGLAGNSVGEQWVDSSTSSYYLRVWTGSTWQKVGALIADSATVAGTAGSANFATVAGSTIMASGAISASGAIMASGAISASGAIMASGAISASEQSWRQELFQLLEQSWRQELFQLLEQLLLHPYCLAVFPLPAQVRQVLWFT
jgi:hypothetical protein